MVKFVFRSLVGFGAVALLLGGALALPEANASSGLHCFSTYLCDGFCITPEAYCSEKLGGSCECKKDVIV